MKYLPLVAYSAVKRQLSRRRVILGTGTLAAGTISGIALTTNNATATVDGEFTIPNGKTVLADTTLQDVRLQADVSWGFDSNAPIHGVEVELHAGATPDTADMLARHVREDVGADALEGEATLSGSLLEASDFDVDNFTPDSGELSTSVVAALELFIRRNGEVVAEASQTEAFQVTVSNEELQVDTSLSGSGSVTFETGTDSA